MCIRETIAVYCGNYTKHINALRKQNSELLNAETGGKYVSGVLGKGLRKISFHLEPSLRRDFVITYLIQY
jgi:hypothetical protein